MKKEIILKETSDWLDGYGICSVLTEQFDVPWKTSFNGVDLDLDYYANHSQNKIVSNLVEILLDDSGKLSDDDLIKLARIIFNKYGDNWKRVFDAFALEYNPIQNYNGDENYTDTETIDRDKTNSLTRDETVKNTGTQSTKGTVKNTGTQSDTGSTVYKGSESDSSSKSNTGTQKTVEDTTDNTTFGNSNYKETTEYGKVDTDVKTFPQDRKSTKSISGGYTDTHTNSNLTSVTDSYAKSYTQNRINAFNGGLVISDDSETLDGVGNGSGGAGGTPGSGNSNQSKTVESGSYNDKRAYNSYEEEVVETGSEQDKSTLSGSDILSVSGSKTQNEDKDSEIIRTDNLTETTSNTHSFSGRSDDRTNTRTDDLTESTDNTRTDNLNQELESSESGEEAEDTTRTLEHVFHREGNLGVTSTQDMLTQEIELRQKYSSLFDAIVFPDIDKVMTMSVFKPTYLY